MLSLVDDVLDILAWILGCIAPRDSAAGVSWFDILFHCMYNLLSRAKHQGGTLLSLIHIMCKSLGTFALGEWILNFYFELFGIWKLFQMSLISGFQPSRVVWPYFIFGIHNFLFMTSPQIPLAAVDLEWGRTRVAHWTNPVRALIVGWARELVPVVLPSCDLFCRKGVAEICWGLWWIWKSSFGGLLSTEQHPFKDVLISF